MIADMFVYKEKGYGYLVVVRGMKREETEQREEVMKCLVNVGSQGGVNRHWNACQHDRDVIGCTLRAVRQLA